MTRTLTLLSLAAAAALAGCNKSDHTIIAGPPEGDNAVVNSAEIKLPPSIAASKAYRCKDNSLVYIDWLSDGSARVKKSREEIGSPVPTGSPILAGTATDKTITYDGKSCKA